MAKERAILGFTMKNSDNLLFVNNWQYLTWQAFTSGSNFRTNPTKCKRKLDLIGPKMLFQPKPSVNIPIMGEASDIDSFPKSSGGDF